jgi:glycosyltransferase involved in cell wall biosynthesis
VTASSPPDNRSAQLRILTVANVPPDPNSGAAGTVYATNEAFRELGHEVDEIWADRLGPRRIAHGNLHSLLEQPRAYRREVAKAVASRDYDVVMISQPQGYLAARFLKQNAFAGVVINRSHGLELRVDQVLPEWHRRLGVPESRRPWLSRLLKPLLNRQWAQAVRWFDGVVLPSHDDREYLSNLFQLSPRQAVTIHHGIPSAFLNTPIQVMTAERQRKLLYVGQFSFIKGPDILIDVLNQVMRNDKSLTMTWVTSQDAHAEISRRLSETIRSRVHLLPWVPQERLLPLLDAHGVFLFPSLFEGAGKACAEALARGLFVIASDTGGMRDHLAQSDPGGLCAVGDVKAFIAAIERCATQTLDADASRDRVSKVQHLTWLNCASSLVEYFHDRRQAAG